MTLLRRGAWLPDIRGFTVDIIENDTKSLIEIIETK